MRVQLFSWLEPRLPGCRVLDLCAGSGILGCEALSRGASRAVFIESDPRTAETIRTSLARLAAPGEVITDDARRYLRRVSEHFDLVFVDPPYEESELRHELLGLLAHGGPVAPGGYLVLEAPHTDDAVSLLARNWRLLRQAAYARADLSLFRWFPEGEEDGAEEDSGQV